MERTDNLSPKWMNVEKLKALGLYNEALQDSIARLAKRYASHLKPVEAVRKELDKKLKKRSLTEAIMKVRE